MSCIICKGTPYNEPLKKDHILIEDGTKHGARSEKIHLFCPDCHGRGNYSSLASAVIAAAIEDYCYPNTANKSRLSQAIADQTSARGFLFSDQLIMWAQQAEVPVSEIKSHVKKIVAKQNIKGM